MDAKFEESMRRKASELELKAATAVAAFRDCATNIRTLELRRQIDEYRPNDVLAEEVERLENGVAEAKATCEDVRRALKLKDRDQDKLNKGKRLLNIGIELTGVRFDFSSDGSKGYVANRKTGYLKPFDTSEHPNDLESTLWRHIEEGSGTDYDDIFEDFKTTIRDNSNKENLKNDQNK